MYLEGERIDTLYVAYLWLREAWMYEPYNIWYETFGEKDSEYYRECIYVVPVRGYDDAPEWDICSLEEFETFIKTH